MFWRDCKNNYNLIICHICLQRHLQIEANQVSYAWEPPSNQPIPRNACRSSRLVWINSSQPRRSSRLNSSISTRIEILPHPIYPSNSSNDARLSRSRRRGYSMRGEENSIRIISKNCLE